MNNTNNTNTKLVEVDLFHYCSGQLCESFTNTKLNILPSLYLYLKHKLHSQLIYTYF